MKRYIKRIDSPMTIHQLCSACNITPSRLAEINELSNSELYVGQRLVIEETDGQEYIVKPFDTLEKIAKYFGVAPEIIMEYNQIDNVFLGQKIFVPTDK